MAKSTVAVVVGRFQVPKLTSAHEDVFRAIVEEHSPDYLMVVLGVSPTDGRSARNPLTFAQRQEVVLSATVGKMYPLDTILPLSDHADDRTWSNNLDRLIRAAYPPDRYIVMLYGGRDSFSGSYTGTYPVINLSTLVSDKTSGTDVRENIIERTCDVSFLEGQTFALNSQYPRAYATVDGVVFNRDDRSVLLIRRADNDEWGFVGGFVDPTDASLEEAVKREVREEVGLVGDGSAKYLGSMIVNDWRYRRGKDKIITSVFLIPHAWGDVTCDPDEVAEVRWASIDGLAVDLLISAAHRRLWSEIVCPYLTRETE